jgi:integrase
LASSNISFTDQGALISVSWSKTIQFQNRTLTIPLPFMPASPLCPSTALWLSTQQATPRGVSPFQYPVCSGLSFLTYSRFLQTLKTLLSQLGINPDHYSGHSFRRGGASFALEAGANPELVQAQGDWRSEAYKLYIDPSLSARRQVAALMAAAVSNLSS